MAPVIFNTIDGAYCLDLSLTVLIDGTDEFWYKKFIVSKYNAEVFKGMKKEQVRAFAEQMQIDKRMIGSSGIAKDKTISQLLSDIEVNWDDFLKSSWDWCSDDDSYDIRESEKTSVIDGKGKLVEIMNSEDVFYIQFKKWLLHHLFNLFKKTLIRRCCIT